MKKILLILFSINVLLNAKELTNQFNAYNEDAFVSIEYGMTLHESVKSAWGFTTENLTKRGDKGDITVLTGLEFELSKKDSIFASTSIGIRHNGSFNAAMIDGRFIYKKNSLKAFLGGYFGFGLDKTSFDGFNVVAATQTGGSKAIHLQNDTTPTVILTGFEIGGEYIINKHWTIGTKLALDGRQYNLNIKYDREDLLDLTAGATLNFLKNEQKDDQINAIKAVVSMTYSF